MERRGFLGGLVALVVAKPKVTPVEVAKLTGVEVSGFASLTSYASGEALSFTDPSPPRTPWAVASQARHALLKVMKPEWWMQRRRLEARRVTHLDPDLASLKSVSVSAKIRIQRDNNFHCGLQNEEHYLWTQAQEEIWKG